MSRLPRTGGGRGPVRCPICLELLDWERAPRMVRIDDEYQPFPSSPSPGRRELFEQRAFRRCSGSLQGSSEASSVHHLPEQFGARDVRQLVIALVGDTAAGKTHLLATIVHRLTDTAAQSELGLEIGALDVDLHNAFMAENVRPLLDRSRRVRYTPPNHPIGFADAFLVRNRRTGKRFAVAFFDVAGERITAAEHDTAFFQAADALIFVVDPEVIRGLNADGKGGETGDAAFDRVLGLLPRSRKVPGYPVVELPAAVVMAKSDRFVWTEPLVRHWMHDRGDDDLDLTSLREESEDVYAFVSARGGSAWLRPVELLYPNSLHFVSATGKDAPNRDADEYRGVVRPRRVLKPLVSLFAMTGVLEAMNQ